MRDGETHAKSYQRLFTGIPVEAALREIESRPDLWDQYTERTRAPESPHRDSHDIWLRFRPRRELLEPMHYGEPHHAEFYPAWHALPAVQRIVWDLVGLLKPVHLGAILITKIPPGKRIHAHNDNNGAWNALYMNCKLWVPLKTNRRCVRRFEDGSVVMKAGSAWAVNNLQIHSVENYGDEEVITLIPTMRVER